MYAGNDVPPWVAIGFRTLKSNGNYRYVWLYKGRFSDPEDNNETKADSINFQSDTIKGQFVKLEYGVSVDGSVRKAWKYEIDEDNALVNAIDQVGTEVQFDIDSIFKSERRSAKSEWFGIRPHLVKSVQVVLSTPWY